MSGEGLTHDKKYIIKHPMLKSDFVIDIIAPSNYHIQKLIYYKKSVNNKSSEVDANDLIEYEIVKIIMNEIDEEILRKHNENNLANSILHTKASNEPHPKDQINNKENNNKAILRQKIDEQFPDRKIEVPFQMQRKPQKQRKRTGDEKINADAMIKEMTAIELLTDRPVDEKIKFYRKFHPQQNYEELKVFFMNLDKPTDNKTVAQNPIWNKPITELEYVP